MMVEEERPSSVWVHIVERLLVGYLVPWILEQCKQIGIKTFFSGQVAGKEHLYKAYTSCYGQAEIEGQLGQLWVTA